jgi:hypothetical protein
MDSKKLLTCVADVTITIVVTITIMHTFSVVVTVVWIVAKRRSILAVLSTVPINTSAIPKSSPRLTFSIMLAFHLQTRISKYLTKGAVYFDYKCYLPIVTT